MNLGVYSIRDCKTGFMAPTLEQNGDCAIRNFTHAIEMTTDSLFFTHASDFSLWHIGDFSTDTGLITPVVPPVHLMDADQIKKGDKDEERKS